MLFNENKLIFKPMHVHVNAWLTSLHHSTYASMHVHILYMFMIFKQSITNKQTNKEIK